MTAEGEKRGFCSVILRRRDWRAWVWICVVVVVVVVVVVLVVVVVDVEEGFMAWWWYQRAT